MNKEQFETIVCNVCKIKTKHKTHLTKRIDGEDSHTDWFNLYQIIECCGCGNVIFRDRLWFSEFQDSDPQSDAIYEDKYYPPINKSLIPHWVDDIENEILLKVIKETYSAHNNGLCIITAIGFRTIIDIIFTEKINDIGGFDKKLNKIFELNYITSDEKELLDIVINSGHASAHRGHNPSNKDILILFKIIEEIIPKLYFPNKKINELLSLSKELKKKIPKWKK